VSPGGFEPPVPRYPHMLMLNVVSLRAYAEAECVIQVTLQARLKVIKLGYLNNLTKDKENITACLLGQSQWLRL
jgi:hypothetical protein